MVYVLYNIESGQPLGTHVNGDALTLAKNVYRVFTDEEIQFLEILIDHGKLPDQSGVWIDNWSDIHNIFLYLRPHMWDWWAMRFDEELYAIDFSSALNFRLEEMPT